VRGRSDDERCSKDPSLNNRIGWRSGNPSPVMPQWVGIHVFPCCDQQERGWRAFVRHNGVGIARAAREAVIPHRVLTLI
jgi:hypothetical protein